MVGAQQPYMYDAVSYNETRFPAISFDPKAITRASWEPKPVKPKRRNGPLVSFNRHPDAHEVRGPRTPCKTLGPRTKLWIKRLRTVQLGHRVLELISAAAILFLMIVIDNVSPLTAWVMRITAGVVMIQCIYSIVHLSRPAGARPPGSSAGYQVFSAISDLCVLPLYAFGTLAVRNSSDGWSTLLSDKSMINYFLPSLSYTLVGAVGFHFGSLIIGFWLAIKFRQIARMPPDMNPLEDNLTSRPHKNNRLSVVTTSTSFAESDKRFSGPLDERRHSGLPCEDIDHPPSIPFCATRSSPRSSVGSADLPSRQYQITPGNSPRSSPRNSTTAVDLKRMSAPPSSSSSSIPPQPPPRSPWRTSYASYAEVPTQDVADSYASYAGVSGQIPGSPGSSGYQPRASTGTVHSQHPAIANAQTNTALPRAARFNETWYISDSLMNRTHEKSRAMKVPANNTKGQGYEAINRRYDLSDSDPESDYENDENRVNHSYGGVMRPGPDEADENDGDLGSKHPNPLRSNPSLPNVAGAAGKVPAGRRPNTPIMRKSSALSEIDLNAESRVSGSNRGNHGDITDEKPSPRYGGLKASLSKRYTWGGPRNRDGSIQPESEFFSKPYGDLRAGTPPVVVGSDRQVSSGNDYDLDGAGGGSAANRYFSFGRRSVSGKVVEEGLSIGWAR